MVEHVRKSGAFGLAILLGAGLLGSGPVAAQPADDVSVAAGVNADTVDGKHAVSATNRAKSRANKLVAANRQGLLPSNILKPIWSLLQGIPAILVDGQIDWAEVVGIPPGFADGVDNGGAFASEIRGPYTTAAGAHGFVSVMLSAASDVEITIIPDTVNNWLTIYEEQVMRNNATMVSHLVRFHNPNAMDVQWRARITTYAEGIAPAALERQLERAKVTVRPSRRHR